MKRILLFTISAFCLFNAVFATGGEKPEKIDYKLLRGYWVSLENEKDTIVFTERHTLDELHSTYKFPGIHYFFNADANDKIETYGTFTFWGGHGCSIKLEADQTLGLNIPCDDPATPYQLEYCVKRYRKVD